MLQTQLDDRLGCLWTECPTDSFVLATLAFQRPKTSCSPLVEPAFERTRRVATPTPVQLRGQSQSPTKGVTLVLEFGQFLGVCGRFAVACLNLDRLHRWGLV